MTNENLHLAHREEAFVQKWRDADGLSSVERMEIGLPPDEVIKVTDVWYEQGQIVVDPSRIKELEDGLNDSRA